MVLRAISQQISCDLLSLGVLLTGWSYTLKDTMFKDIDELLLQVYYVSEKSPKKCQELKDIVDSLKQCLTDTEGRYPTTSGKWDKTHSTQGICSGKIGQ